MSLDDKLKQAIFKPGVSTVWDEVAKEVIAEVKQAFADEGYIPPLVTKHGNKLTHDFISKNEFINQFDHELSLVLPKLGVVKSETEYQIILEAAKRAAGLTE